jgi:TolB protein
VRVGAVVLATVLLGLGVVSLPAGATSLGMNGQIAWDNPNGAGTVYTANQDGKHVFRLTGSSSCCAAWSPDGKRLLVSGSYPGDGGRIGSAIVNANGTGFHALPLPATPGFNVGCGAWSPDGTHCVGQGWDDQKPLLNGIYQLNVNDGSAVQLTSGYDIPGSYSPDGSQIVFGRYDANQNGLGLYIVNSNGTGLHLLLREDFQPANDGNWSPQGNQIVFSQHVTPTARGSIWVINSNGAGLHQITVAGLDCGGSVGCHEPQWSPDGTKIVFATNSAQGSFVYTMNADGTGLKRIATGDDPAWGTHPGVACTPVEKTHREKALAKFRRSMTAKQRAYFRTHRSRRARRAFLKRQKTELKKLEALVAACD